MSFYLTPFLTVAKEEDEEAEAEEEEDEGEVEVGGRWAKVGAKRR